MLQNFGKILNVYVLVTGSSGINACLVIVVKNTSMQRVKDMFHNKLLIHSFVHWKLLQIKKFPKKIVNINTHTRSLIHIRVHFDVSYLLFLSCLT